MGRKPGPAGLRALYGVYIAPGTRRRHFIPEPLSALVKVERFLRGTDAYALCMDHYCDLGLGEYLKLVIKRATVQKKLHKRNRHHEGKKNSAA